MDRYPLCLLLLKLAGPMVVATICGFPSLCLAAEHPVDPADAEAFTSSVQPLLKKYCYECHSGSEPEAEMGLDTFRDAEAVLAKREAWTRVQENLEGRVMPPDDHPQPSDAEVETITAWIETAFSKHDCTLAKDPGRVTIRRLNRAEYNNTIRDLVGVDFKPAKDFPSDDVGYGFDNIGDVLSLPPLLLEKYMTAAEQIVETAIVVEDLSQLASRKFQAAELQFNGTSGGSGRLNSEGELRTRFDFPKDGHYLLRARAYGDQAGSEPARMSFKLEDKTIHTADVTAEEDEPQVYETRAYVEAGNRQFAVAFLNDFYDPKSSNRDERDRNLIVDYLEIVGPIDDLAGSLPEPHRRIMIAKPGGGNEWDAARKIIENFARRAYRRPVSAEEVDRLLRLFGIAQDDGAPFEVGIQLAVQAILVSPHFLFRVEMDKPATDGAYALNDYELASRLSYFLWSSMPDDELFEQARRGTLRQEIEPQVRRMLRDPKSRALVDNFAGQWLQIRSMDLMTPDKRLFPDFDDPLRSAMKTETELFFEEILREDRSVLDFLTADFTYLNERLARHYGIEGVRGDEFRRVPLQSNQRGGVLTQASILTLTSNATRTSPVKRGKWVLENLLGTPPPPPPPGVEELSEAEEVVLSGSLRKRMEMHRTNASCASCHSRMDPIGFGLENYNAIGAWRTEDGKFPIDASGTLPGGKHFDGPHELKQILKSRHSQFARCLTEKMLTYALGRGLESYDRCTVDQVAGQLAKKDYLFSTLILEIATSDPFQMRRGTGEKP